MAEGLIAKVSNTLTAHLLLIVSSAFLTFRMLFHLQEFYKWRDQHVLEEIYKYGWYIDFWLENGLYRVRLCASVDLYLVTQS